MNGTQESVLTQNDLSVYEGKFSYWKSGILAAITLIFSAVLGYFLEDLIYRFDQSASGSFIYLIVFLVLFLSFFLLSVFFIGRKWYLFGISLLSVIGIILPTIVHFNLTILLGGVVALLIFISAFVLGRSQLEEVIKFRFFRISKTILSRLILALALIASIFLYDSLLSKPLDANNPILPQSVFDGGVGLITSSAGSLFGGFDFSMSLRQLAQKAVDDAVSQNGASIPDSLKTELVNKAISDYQDKLKSVFGNSVNPDQKISTAIYNSLLERFNKLDQTTKSLVLIGLVALFFLSIQAISPIIRPLISFIAFCIFEFLMVINFGAIISEKKNKETVILS